MSRKILQEIQMSLDIEKNMSSPLNSMFLVTIICFPPEQSLVFGFTSSIDFSKACFRGDVHFVAFPSQLMTRTSTGAAFCPLM